MCRLWPRTRARGTPSGGFAGPQRLVSSPTKALRLRPAPAPERKAQQMIGESLSTALNDFERYLSPDYADFGALSPRPETKPFEVEMRLRLDDGGELSVVEHAATMADLSEAMDRVRMRIAMSIARGLVDEGAPVPAPR